MKSTRRAARAAPNRRTQAPLAEALDHLLRKHGLSISELARRLEVSQPFLSRAVRAADQKRASRELLQAIADELGVQPNYFIEYRRFEIADAVARDPRLTDAVYRLVKRAERGG